MSATLIESAEQSGVYDMTATELIVRMDDGRLIYLADGYGGEDSPEGGCYRWRHGIAIALVEGDTLDFLHEDAPGYDAGMTRLDLASNGYDTARPLLDWSGNRVAQVARSTQQERKKAEQRDNA